MAGATVVGNEDNWEDAWRVWEKYEMLYAKPQGLEDEDVAEEYLEMNAANRTEFRGLIRTKFGPVWAARFAQTLEAYRSRRKMLESLNRPVPPLVS